MVLIAVRDLMFRSKLQEAARRTGAPVTFAARDASLEQAVREAGATTLVVDLTPPGVLDEVRAARRAAPLRVVGFLGHLQTELMEEARSAGVDEVLTRGQLVSRIDAILRAAGDAGAAPAR